MTELVPPPQSSGKSLLDRVEDALLPLINLVFLLLMFFIVAGQLADTPLPELPAAANASDPAPPDADLVLLASGELKVAGLTVARDRLLQQLPSPDASPILRIAAAGSVTMADLEELLRTLEQGGFRDVILLTEPQP